MNTLRRGRLLTLAVVSAAILSGQAGTPLSFRTLHAEGVMPPGFIELVRTSSVLIVTPARLDVASEADAYAATAWHTFRVQETLSTTSRGKPLTPGRPCKKPKTDFALVDREVALPFVGAIGASDSLPLREWGRFKPEMGRRYLVVVSECADGIAAFPYGPVGFFELGADGRIVPGRWGSPEAREFGSVDRVRQLIADLAAADRDTPSAILVGRTVDALSGQPVGGATVRLRGLHERLTQSTADGWFLLRDVTPFSYLIDARKEGWVQSDGQTPAEQIRLRSGERRGDVTLRMHRAPGVRATVMDEHGAPLGGAQVLAIRLGDAGVVPRRMGGRFGGRADDLGRFSIDGLAPGDYLVAASLPPLSADVERDDRADRRFYPVTFYPGGTSPSGAAVIALGADDTPHDVAVSVKSLPARRIDGRVRHSGQPVGGALLRLDVFDPLFDIDRANGGLGSRSGRTAADGTFVFDNVATGEYIVSLPSHESPDDWFSRRVTVADRDAGGVTLDVPDVVMAQLLIAGRRAPTASNQSTAAGTSRVEGVVRDVADGRPMTRTLVTLLNTATRSVRRIETDSDGSFAFARVSSGRYALSGTREGYIPAAEPTDGAPLQTEFSIGNGEAVRAQLDMTRCAVITGTVFDETGAPVRGAQMAVRRFVVQDGVPTLQVVREQRAGFELGIAPDATDREGRYRITGLSTGDYVVSASVRSSGGGVPQITQGEIDRVLADLRREPRANPGTPSVSMPASSASRTTPPVATPAQVPPVRLPTFHPDSPDALRATRVHVKTGSEAAGVDIHLAPASSAKVTLKVTSVDGSPAGEIIRVKRTDLQTDGTFPVDRGENGTYVIRGIPPGRYAIIADTPGVMPPARRMWARVDLDVGATDIDDVALVLQPALTVRGRVVVEDGAGPIGAARLAGSLRPIAPTVAAGSLLAAIGTDGTFTIRGVMPGRYRFALEMIVNAPLTWTVRSVAVGGVEQRDGTLEIIQGAVDPDEVVVRLGPR